MAARTAKRKAAGKAPSKVSGKTSSTAKGTATQGTAAKKTVKREPTPAAVLKKVGAISDTTKVLQKEIKTMTRIFADNQKVLVSMKGMIDTLASTLENIQKQSKQISILEDDTQKLYAGLNQVRAHSDIIARINDQTTSLQAEVAKISKTQKSAPKTDEIRQQITDSADGIRNNSKMIIKIAQRIDDVRDDLKRVGGKTDTLLDVKDEIEKLKADIGQVYQRADRTEADAQIKELRAELGKLSAKAASISGINSELGAIKSAIDGMSEKTSGIDSLSAAMDGLKQQFEAVSARADAAGSGVESLRDMAGKVDTIEAKISSLSQRADSTAFVGEGLKSVQEDLTGFKKTVSDSTDGIEKKISLVSDILKRQDAAASEFHKKSERLFSELKSVRTDTDKVSRDSSKEVMALLKLSEYQSTMRNACRVKVRRAKGAREHGRPDRRDCKLV